MTEKLTTGLCFKSRNGITGWSDARLAEIDFHKNMGYFLKIDGQSNQTGKTEQVQIWLNEQDSADLVAILIKLMRKNGGNETLERFLELREITPV
jgi:hypothetical protein